MCQMCQGLYFLSLYLFSFSPPFFLLPSFSFLIQEMESETDEKAQSFFFLFPLLFFCLQRNRKWNKKEKFECFFFLSYSGNGWRKHFFFFLFLSILLFWRKEEGKGRREFWLFSSLFLSFILSFWDGKEREWEGERGIIILWIIIIWSIMFSFSIFSLLFFWGGKNNERKTKEKRLVRKKHSRQSCAF